MDKPSTTAGEKEVNAYFEAVLKQMALPEAAKAAMRAKPLVRGRRRRHARAALVRVEGTLGRIFTRWPRDAPRSKFRAETAEIRRVDGIF